MDLQLQSASWLEMARRLPSSILERSPVLAMGYGWATLDMGDMEGVFRHTREALAHTPNDQYQKRSVITMLLAIAHWGTGELNTAET